MIYIVKRGVYALNLSERTRKEINSIEHFQHQSAILTTLRIWFGKISIQEK